MSFAAAREKRIPALSTSVGSSTATAVSPDQATALGLTPAVAQATELRSLIASGPVQKHEAPGSLPGALRGRMERMFGADFSGVRVFQDGQAPAGVNAYTQGSTIHFAPGRYAPDTVQGRALLGHELAHVVQQRSGQVAPGVDAWGGLRVNQEPHLEHDADRWGERAAGLGFQGSFAQAPAHSGGGAATAQLNGGFATLEEAVDGLTDQSRKHIMVPKHKWNLVIEGFTSPESEKAEAAIPEGAWESVSAVMKDVVKNGADGAYKKVSKKSLGVNGQTVEVTYIKFKDGTFRVSDAWVVS